MPNMQSSHLWTLDSRSIFATPQPITKAKTSKAGRGIVLPGDPHTIEHTTWVQQWGLCERVLAVTEKAGEEYARLNGLDGSYSTRKVSIARDTT